MVLTDRPMPIRKGKEKRPGEDVLLAAIRRGEVQRVLVWSVDRIGRSLPDLIAFIETCRSAGVGLYLHDREIDTTTSNGLSLFDLTSMMAFHLRQSRRDRILRGQAAARNLNVKFGRPPISVAKTEKAKELLASGTGVRRAAKLAGISAASVSRLKAGIELLSTAR
jgi:DNA invertase Pin-like site-specific DNA recombinase